MSFLFSLLIVFVVFSWLPNFGSVNSLMFATFAVVIAFMLTLTVLDSSLTVLQPYPANSTIINVGGNLTITNQAAVFTTHIYEDTWQLSYVFLMFGLISTFRMIALMLMVWKETSGDRARIM